MDIALKTIFKFSFFLQIINSEEKNNNQRPNILWKVTAHSLSTLFLHFSSVIFAKILHLHEQYWPMQQSSLGHDEFYLAPMEITYQKKKNLLIKKRKCSERKSKSAESTQITSFDKNMEYFLHLTIWQVLC